MAESIYTQLENQTILTPVDGKDYRHALPIDLFPTDEQFESNDQLIAWAEEHGYTAMLIQKGLQKAIIEVRATFKSCPKNKIWSEEMGTKNLDDLEWKTVDRPNQGGSHDKENYNKCTQMIAKLSGKGMDKETVIDLTSDVYGLDIVESIFKELELLKG